MLTEVLMTMWEVVEGEAMLAWAIWGGGAASGDGRRSALIDVSS
jgi:hypothetical protein